MTDDDIIFDPSTGLPQLGANFAFRVERNYNHYAASLSNIEIYGNYDNDLYIVSIVELEPQKFSKPEPIYKKNWIFQQIVGYTEPKPLPREAKGDYYGLRDITTIAKQYSEDDLPEDMAESSKLKLTRFRLESEKNGWDTNRLFLYKALELNDENIKEAAIRIYKRWKASQAEELAREIKDLKRRELEDKYTGLYPPKGIKTDE